MSECGSLDVPVLPRKDDAALRTLHRVGRVGYEVTRPRKRLRKDLSFGHDGVHAGRKCKGRKEEEGQASRRR